jgi:isochorismate pyruvate lyase
MARHCRTEYLVAVGMDENNIIAPENCQTMVDVRSGVDAIDAALLKLLVTRFGYMNAAARIKTERGAVRDEVRKAQIIQSIRSSAEKQGMPADALAAMWDDLIEASIAYELDIWDQKRR